MADARPRKRAKVFYAHKSANKRARDLCMGMCGVLVTTAGMERQCVAEAYNLLNEYADNLYGAEFDDKEVKEHSEGGKKEDAELEEEFASEVKRLKQGTERRFQAANSGAKNVIFIECRNPVDPCELVHAILSDVQKSGVCRARFCQRLTPVSAVCHASLQDITKHAPPLLQPHFHASVDPEPVQFSVHYKSRNNNTLKRDQVIKLLASLVTDEGAYPHTVCLDNPQLVVSANIIRGLCCLTVVKDYIALKQYNLQAVCEQQKSDTTHTASATDTPTTTATTTTNTTCLGDVDTGNGETSESQRTSEEEKEQDKKIPEQVQVEL